MLSHFLLFCIKDCIKGYHTYVLKSFLIIKFTRQICVFVYALNSFIYASPWVKTIQAFNASRTTVQIGTNIGRSSTRTYVVRAFCISFKKM